MRFFTSNCCKPGLSSLWNFSPESSWSSTSVKSRSYNGLYFLEYQAIRSIPHLWKMLIICWSYVDQPMFSPRLRKKNKLHTWAITGSSLAVAPTPGFSDFYAEELPLRGLKADFFLLLWLQTRGTKLRFFMFFATKHGPKIAQWWFFEMFFEHQKLLGA